jgi:hypothetical protein
LHCSIPKVATKSNNLKSRRKISLIPGGFIQC